MFSRKVEDVVKGITKMMAQLETIQLESQKQVDELADKIVTVTYERDDAANWLKGFKKLQGGEL